MPELRKSTKSEDKIGKDYKEKIIDNTVYFEISAKEPDRVDSSFKKLLTNVMNNHN